MTKIATVLAFGMAAASANAATIINGSFELGTDPGSFSTEAAGSSAITGWEIGGFGVDYIGSYWQASDGVRSVDLSGLSAGSISQSIATVIGTTYTVNFDLSGNPDAGADSKITVVTISGSLPDVKTYDVLASNSRENMNWQNYSYTFTAFSTLSALTFGSAEFNAFGPAIDNVSIISDGGGSGIGVVPEPSTWAMLLIGFGMVGATVRRRRNNSVAA